MRSSQRWDLPKPASSTAHIWTTPSAAALTRTSSTKRPRRCTTTLAASDRRRGFTYHCAHSYWSYARTAEAIFGEEGKALAEEVLSDLAKDWGKEYAERIATYRDTDFERI